jgi:serine/threonine protein kinase
MQQRQEEKLGSGGFSSVYRPKSLKEGQRSHVRKRPNPNVSQKQKEHTLKKYQRQKLLLDKIHELNPTKSSLFNQIYGFQENQALMRDLGNTDLLEIVRKHPDLLERDLDNVISQLVDAFVILFRSGVIHKDIKLNNIMAQYNEETGHYTITLIDFADSMTMKEIAEKYNKFIIGGTKRFMSPEILHRMYVTGDTSKGTWMDYMTNDLWSLGMVLYYLLYGKHLHTMFMKMYPTLKNKNKTPNMFYENMKNRPELYQQLFPTEILSERKRKYVPLVRSLLSLDPKDRLRWLKSHLQQQKRKSGNIPMLLKASRQIQKKQQEKRKSRLDMLVEALQQKQQKTKPSGIQMLVKALEQQKQKSR